MVAAGRRGGVDMSVSKVEISFLPQSIRHISQKGVKKRLEGVATDLRVVMDLNVLAKENDHISFSYFSSCL